MPSYTFRHQETGAVREASVPIAQRDDPLPDDPLHYWKRDLDAPGLNWKSPDGKTQAERAMDGYYRLECEEGSRFRSGFSKNHIKKTWQRSRQAEQAGLIT